MSNKIDLNWHTFNDHLLENVRHLLLSKQFADVTLVCDDNIHLKAHSFILSSCSSVFSNLFNGDCQSNAMVFLKGIDHRDLDQILQFMYNGKATFSEDRMNSFIAASKSIEVKEISTGFEDKKTIKNSIQNSFLTTLLKKLMNPYPKDSIVSRTFYLSNQE